MSGVEQLYTALNALQTEEDFNTFLAKLSPDESAVLIEGAPEVINLHWIDSSQFQEALTKLDDTPRTIINNFATRLLALDATADRWLTSKEVTSGNGFNAQFITQAQYFCETLVPALLDQDSIPSPLTGERPKEVPVGGQGEGVNFTDEELEELANLLGNASDYHAHTRYRFAGRLLTNNFYIPSENPHAEENSGFRMDRPWSVPGQAVSQWWNPHEEVFYNAFYDATTVTDTEVRYQFCSPLASAVTAFSNTPTDATAAAYLGELDYGLCSFTRPLFENLSTTEIDIRKVYAMAVNGSPAEKAFVRQWMEQAKRDYIPTTPPPNYGGLIPALNYDRQLGFVVRRSVEEQGVEMFASERVVDLVSVMLLIGSKGRARVGFLGQKFPFATTLGRGKGFAQLAAFTAYAHQVDFENPVLNIGADLFFVAAPRSNIYGIGAGMATDYTLHTVPFLNENISEEAKEDIAEDTTLGVAIAHLTKKWWWPGLKSLVTRGATTAAPTVVEAGAVETVGVGGTAAAGSTSVAGPVALIIGGILALGKMGEIQDEDKADIRIFYTNQKTKDDLALLTARLAKKGSSNELTNEKVRALMSETLGIKGADADYTYPNEGLIFKGRREYTQGYRVMLEYGDTMQAYYVRVKDVKEGKMTQADFDLWIRQGLPIGSYATPGLAYGIDERTRSLGSNGRAALYVLIEETTGGRVNLTTSWDGKSMEGTEEFRQALCGISDQNLVASAG